MSEGGIEHPLVGEERLGHAQVENGRAEGLERPHEPFALLDGSRIAAGHRQDALADQVCRHGDATIEALDLDAPGSVPHWQEGRRATTLGVLLIRMVDETAHHAGHADICREIIDGTGQADAAEIGDSAYWSDYVATIQAAAETFRKSS